jgi:flavodoxin/ferredoxin
MKKMCLCFFSGTGMTKYVVDRLVNEFEKHHVSVACFKIEDVAIYDLMLSEYDVFGIAYPVHAFNAPQIVIDFVKRLPESNGINTFIINTAGEGNPINYSASDLLIKKLSGKGYKVFYNKLIGMPSNFVVKYEEAKVNRILDKANENIPRIAGDIITVTPYAMEKSFTSKIFTVIGKVEWYGAHVIGKFFYVKGGCNRCGKCVDNCPNQNIVMNEKSIKFKWHCGMCMRCIYLCPKSMIGAYQPFSFIHFDKWYDSEIFKRKK